MGNNHVIQIIGLQKEGGLPVLKTIGLVVVEDDSYVVYNPALKGQEKLHWTYHKDGTQHFKDHDGNIKHSIQKIPLENLNSTFQFLFAGAWPKMKYNFDYKVMGNNYGLFLVDLTNFKKNVSMSIHISNFEHLEKCCNLFFNYPEHQCFIYWKSKPKIVIHVWDN